MEDNNINKTEILRYRESTELVASVKDSVTQNLLSAASVCVINRFLKKENLPIQDFDLRFFSEAMLELFEKHELLQKILNGEEVGWFDE